MNMQQILISLLILVCKNNHFLYFSIIGLSCSSRDWQCKIQLHVSVAGSPITAKVWGPYIVSRCWRVGNTSSQASFHVDTHRNIPLVASESFVLLPQTSLC